MIVKNTPKLVEAIKDKNIDLIKNLAPYYEITYLHFRLALNTKEPEIFKLLLEFVDEIDENLVIVEDSSNLDKNFLEKITNILYENKEKISDPFLVEHTFGKLKQYEKLIEIFSNQKFISDIFVKSRLAEAYINIKEFEKASLTCQEIIKMSPSLANTFLTRGMLKMDLLKKGPINAIVDHNIPQESIKWIENKIFLEVSNNQLEFNVIFLPLLLPILIPLLLKKYLYSEKIVEDIPSTTEDFLKETSSLANIPELKDVLDVAALNLLTNKNLNIFIVKDMISYCPADQDGYYSDLFNEIVLPKEKTSNEYKGTLVHELWHLAMEKVFQNNLLPYKVGDNIAEQNYKLAINECLKNFYKAMYNKQSPDFNNSMEFGMKLASGEFDNSFVGSFKKIVTNVFGEVITHKIIEDINYIFFPLEEVSDIIKHFLPIYSKPSYLLKKDAELIEFIVRYEDFVARGFSQESLKILEPMKDFIDQFVKPAMQEYIINHEMKDLLLHSHENEINSHPHFQLSECSSESYYEVMFGENSSMNYEAFCPQNC